MPVLSILQELSICAYQDSSQKREEKKDKKDKKEKVKKEKKSKH